MSSICLYCEHAYTNNRDLKKDGFNGNRFACRAYPNEIPYGYPKDDHKEIQHNQVGDYVFNDVPDELFLISLSLKSI
jgi:hypothetical protein